VSFVPPEHFNFAAYVLAENGSRGTKPAYIDDHRTTTYAQLGEQTRRFAGVLAQRGIQREQRILVVMVDTADLPVTFLGALYAGVVPVVVNTLLPASDFAYMLQHSDAKLVVTSGSLLPKVREALATAGSSVDVVVSQPEDETGASGGAQPNEHPFATLMSAAAPAATHADTYADDFAFWLYSSGSTGRPKGTVHSHANLTYTAELYAKPVLGIRESDLVFSAAKLFFAYGLGNALTFPLSVGATVVLMAERPTPDAVFTRLKQHQPTVFCGVPTLFVAMLASAKLPPKSDVAMRVATSAGEMLPQQVGEQWKARYGCDILDGIGSTEMLHIYLSNRPEDVAYGTTGTPVAGYEIELRDDAGKPMPEGEVGDLYVKGPSAALLYWRDREKSRSTFQGAWMKTGDKYRRLPSGHYVYAGRSDDMIKVSGQYLSPVEVELVLQTHASVLEAAVVGKLEENGLQRTCAFVVLREGHEPADALVVELQTYVKGKLAPHKYPREITFVAELPKTATGKIQRFRLRTPG
jgi:benzoate-CoA ligase